MFETPGLVPNHISSFALQMVTLITFDVGNIHNNFCLSVLSVSELGAGMGQLVWADRCT